jgi:hypothetical protein
MTQRKKPARSTGVRTGNLDRFQDEVYRQMFRLEAHRPGSEMELAIALLRAWTASESAPARDARRQWLRRICPLCLGMIEAARQFDGSEGKCIQ